MEEKKKATKDGKLDAMTEEEISNKSKQINGSNTSKKDAPLGRGTTMVDPKLKKALMEEEKERIEKAER